MSWAVYDLRSEGKGVHVLPADEKGRITGWHDPEIGCWCRPVLERNGPLDDPVISHREPSHKGAKYGADA